MSPPGQILTASPRPGTHLSMYRRQIFGLGIEETQYV
jgi:hypothetical protein